MARKTNPIPRPANVYELLGQVAEAIELAPEHYHQGHWAISNSNLRQWSDFDSDERMSKAMREETCGTSFCRAGWMISILDANKKRTPEVWNNCDTMIVERAYALMEKARIPLHDVRALFDGDAVCGTVGSKSYAKKGADGVRKLMSTYADQLKATPITKED